MDRRALFLSKSLVAGHHLDVGSSTGNTISHFVELRPDIHFVGVDCEDYGHLMPKGVEFRRVNIITDTLPFPDNYFDSISMMHVMEHLPQFGRAPSELARVLKPGGRMYVEGPSPRSILFPSSAGHITLNFYDDPTHIAPLSKGRIVRVFGVDGLRVKDTGMARSWPLILGMPWSLVKGDWLHFLAGLIHLGGWNVYVEFEKTVSSGKRFA